VHNTRCCARAASASESTEAFAVFGVDLFGQVVRVRTNSALAIDCHDREAPAFVASPRPLTGADIRTLMDHTLWARFGEATLKAPHAVQWLGDNGPQYTGTASVLHAHEVGLVPITTPALARRATVSLKLSSGRSSATT
jgi:transposase InsO family protein